MANTPHAPEGIYFSPDFRRNAPDDLPYCCRCQKPLKATADRLTGVPVTVNWDTMRLVEGHNQPIAVNSGKTDMVENLLIGSDCYRLVKREHNANKFLARANSKEALKEVNDSITKSTEGK